MEPERNDTVPAVPPELEHMGQAWGLYRRRNLMNRKREAGAVSLEEYRREILEIIRLEHELLKNTPKGE